MTKDDRLQALKYLIQVVQHRVPLMQTMQSAEKVSPFTKALCFGVCRHYYRLEAMADKLVEKRPKSIEVWLVLLLGLYQLHYLEKPEYAVVKESVDLVQKIKKIWAKGLINATLRQFCRQRSSLSDVLLSSSGHPEWFVKRLQNDWPNDWEKILEGNDQHPPMTLRVNQQQISRESYLARLQKAEIDASPTEFSKDGLLLTTPKDVTELPDFAEGMVSVQDEAAQLAMSLLSLAPGLRVLDACCAPGGKTCHILEAMPSLAECVALDIDAHRLQRVKENLSRLHLTATLKQGDAALPDTWWDGVHFDRILLDAPCSATGVIRRHPDIKLLRTEEEIRLVAELQASLLKKLWSLLKPGGLLVYATCSVLPQENERQIEGFLVKQPDALFINKKLPWGRFTGHGWQLLPGDSANYDGFFYSVLQKELA